MKTANPYPRAILFGLLGLVVLMIAVVVAALALIPRADLLAQSIEAIEMIQRVYLIAGIPVMLLFGWLAARRLATRHLLAGAVAGAVPAIIELAIQPFSGGGATAWGTLALTAASKIVAGAVGGWLASRSAPLAAELSDPT